MEQETASLILNTFDINPSQLASTYYGQTIDNQYGTIANNRCTLTWKNINMRLVLGEMYGRYETFNMYLYQINQSSAFEASAPSSAPFALVDVRIKGLPFLNNGYNTTNRNNTNSSYLTSYVLNVGGSGIAGTVTPMFNPTILTFSKSAECVDLTIDMKCTKDQLYPFIIATRSLGTFIFMFKFYGIPTRQQNLITNGSRM